jgi:hypothetical protein
MIIGCVVLALSTAVAVAQTDAEIADVYAVRRVVTSSTCADTPVGGVMSTVYLVSALASESRDGLSVVVVGTRLFRELRGTANHGTVALAGSDGEDGTISIVLTRGAEGTLTGTEEVSLVRASGTCRIVRSVIATPLPAPRAVGDGARPRAGRRTETLPLRRVRP